MSLNKLKYNWGKIVTTFMTLEKKEDGNLNTF